MANKTQVILSEREVNKIKKLAKQDGRSVSGYLRRIIILHLDELDGRFKRRNNGRKK